MKRKIINITIFLLLTAALGGCAGSKDNTGSSPTERPTPATTIEATPTPTVTLEPTVVPEPTVAPEPTAEPEPTATPEPTAAPEPTATPKPTATPMPTATPIPIPVGDTIENVVNGTFPRTGTVVSDGLNVRKDAGASYDVVTMLVKNARVNILSAKQVESGTYWYQVSFIKDEKELSGYVNSKFIAVDYPEHTETPVATPTPLPTATPKPTATPTEAPVGGTIENVVNGTFPRTGIVVSEELNVRKDAGASYDVVAAIVKNTKVTILSAKQVESGTYWYQVSFTKDEKELSGYVNSNYIAVDYSEYTETPIATATPTPTVSPAATPVPEPTVNLSEPISMEEVVDDQAFFLYAAEIQKDMAELKEDFASDAAVIAKLPKNAPVIVINQSNAGDTIWYRIAVKQNGAVIYGYVTNDNVKLLASADAPVAAQIVEEKVRLRNIASATGSYIRDNAGELVSLSMGDFVWIIREVSGQDLQEKWFELAIVIDGEVYTGYVRETPVYLMEAVLEAPVIPTP